MEARAWIDSLMTPAGARLMAELTPYDPAATLAVADRARRELPAEIVSAALTQARLRTRAAERWTDDPAATTLWFTTDALEQATRPAVARYRAAHLVARGATVIADLGCGVGLDTIAFARAGLRVHAMEREPDIAALAQANVAASGFSAQCSIAQAEVTADTVVAADCDAIFLDPARRRDGRRLREVEQWSPPWHHASALASSRRLGAVKVAPGIDRELGGAGTTTEWISHNGDLVEACVWFGDAADPAVSHRATLLTAGASTVDAEALTVTSAGTDLAGGLAAAERGPISEYLLEPDSAIIRAGLVAQICTAVNGWLLDERIAYISCSTIPDASPLYSRFAVRDTLPFSIKSLRAELRRRGIGRVEIKKRGIAMTPEEVRAQLRLDTSLPHFATVLLTRVGSQPVAVIADRLTV
ncbi:MAG TPA: SAM-dependent methyltransferase [Actinobacteria bacterium]|nr:SAM-dependent methyltransferase [Actinomycetota bacterium]